jgi:chloride channel protein, CIC family
MSTTSEGESERLRVPQPLIKKRIASGRGAMEQPNVTGDGDARLTAPFWLAVVVTGVATGLLGDALMAILNQAEVFAYHYHGGNYAAAVAAVPALRRVVMLVVAGGFGAGAWYLIRKYLRHERSEIDDAVWSHDGELSFRRSALTSIVSEIVIGLGASIGREAAPKLMGGASGSVVAHWFALTPAQKRLLVACGGGAGLACVYNVPLGGAIFTAEVLLGSFAIPVVMPALLCSLVATATAYLTLSTRPTYANIPVFATTPSLMTWSVLAGLATGLLAVVYIRFIGWASYRRPKGPHVLWVMPLTFALVGLVGIWRPTTPCSASAV